MSTPHTAADPSAVLDLLDSLEQAIGDLPKLATPSPPSPPPPSPPLSPPSSPRIIPTAARNQLAYLKAGMPAAARPAPDARALPRMVTSSVTAVDSAPRMGADPFPPTRTAHRDPPPKPHGYVATRGAASQVLAAFPWEPQRR